MTKETKKETEEETNIITSVGVPRRIKAAVTADAKLNHRSYSQHACKILTDYITAK